VNCVKLIRLVEDCNCKYEVFRRSHTLILFDQNSIFVLFENPWFICLLWKSLNRQELRLKCWELYEWFSWKVKSTQGLLVTQIVTCKTKFIRFVAPTSHDKQFWWPTKLGNEYCLLYIIYSFNLTISHSNVINGKKTLDIKVCSQRSSHEVINVQNHSSKNDLDIYYSHITNPINVHLEILSF
jgi:hypothetical protein